MQSLAKLVSSEADFEAAFSQSVAIDIQEKGGYGRNNPLTQSQRSTGESRMGTVLEGSKQFMIGDREFEFEENDPIFFV